MAVIRRREGGEVLWERAVAEGSLRGAELCRADLRGADLHGADLRGAYLQGADLREADLRGADLREAHVLDARFSGAIYDAGTRWPRHFRPRLAGCVRRKGRSEVTPAPAREGAGTEAAPADGSEGVGCRV